MAEQQIQPQRHQYPEHSTLELTPNSQWQTSEYSHPAPQVDYSGLGPERNLYHPAPEPAHFPSSSDETPHSAYKGSTPVSNIGSGAAAERLDVARTERPSTICGMRRRSFWIVATVFAILVAIGIGVGIGVGLGSRPSSDTATPGPSSNNTPAVVAHPSAIASYSKLAATNITDQYGNDNFFLFYQLNSGAIKMGSFNRSVNSWSVTALSDHLDVDPADIAPGTSISASGAYRSATAFELNLCWTSTALQIMCYLWYPVSSIPADLPGSWIRVVFPTSYDTANGSAVATYSRSCTFCDWAPFIFWQAPTSGAAIQGAYYDGAVWKTISDVSPESDPVRAKRGTPLFVMPVGINARLTSRNMYYITDSGLASTLTNLPPSDGPATWHRTTMSGSGSGWPSMEQPISITAFSTTGQSVSLLDPDPEDKFQLVDATVLVAGKEHGKTERSVRAQYFADREWRSLSDPVADLADCAEYSVLAANQAGRVYCLVGRVGDDGVSRMRVRGFVRRDDGVGRFRSAGNINVS
ncbi:serine/threonine kinase PknH [Microdochium nivale]|nr:serine/threonine kinase PknH [Microdochium nivale]